MITTPSITKDALHQAPYTLHQPEGAAAPVILSSPHSGRHYPVEFLADVALDPRALRQSEDAFVEEVYEEASKLGVPLLAAKFPRAYVDVNRDPRELDLQMLQKPHNFNTENTIRSQRVKSGLGVIAKMVSSQSYIYRSKISGQDVTERLRDCYDTYHNALARLVNRAVEQNGYCIVVDCHSMPSPKTPTSTLQKTDIILGDRFGESCAPVITNTAERLLKDNGYILSRNIPYAGGYITSKFGRPQQGIHSIQIELARKLYMDERRIQPHDGLKVLRQHLKEVISVLLDLPAALLKPYTPMAEGAE